MYITGFFHCWCAPFGNYSSPCTIYWNLSWIKENPPKANQPITLFSKHRPFNRLGVRKWTVWNGFECIWFPYFQSTIPKWSSNPNGYLSEQPLSGKQQKVGILCTTLSHDTLRWIVFFCTGITKIMCIYIYTVDWSNPANQLRLVVDPIIYKVSYMQGGAGFLPSTVSYTYLIVSICGIRYIIFTLWSFFSNTYQIDVGRYPIHRHT